MNNIVLNILNKKQNLSYPLIFRKITKYFWDDLRIEIKYRLAFSILENILYKCVTDEFLIYLPKIEKQTCREYLVINEGNYSKKFILVYIKPLHNRSAYPIKNTLIAYKILYLLTKNTSIFDRLFDENLYNKVLDNISHISQIESIIYTQLVKDFFNMKDICNTLKPNTKHYKYNGEPAIDLIIPDFYYNTVPNW